MIYFLFVLNLKVHSDHCAKNLLPWFDGMLAADEEYFKLHGEPLFSSHMLDLSEEPKHENIEICKSYLKRMAPMGCLLEMEIGIFYTSFYFFRHYWW
jgi:fructose-bisphosphate aldolase class II